MLPRLLFLACSLGRADIMLLVFGVERQRRTEGRIGPAWADRDGDRWFPTASRKPSPSYSSSSIALFFFSSSILPVLPSSRFCLRAVFVISRYPSSQNGWGGRRTDCRGGGN